MFPNFRVCCKIYDWSSVIYFALKALDFRQP
ncbi:hypothetical protein GJ496_000290, partial [Pomphorhynchus laevis]